MLVPGRSGGIVRVSIVASDVSSVLRERKRDREGNIREREMVVESGEDVLDDLGEIVRCVSSSDGRALLSVVVLECFGDLMFESNFVEIRIVVLVLGEHGKCSEKRPATLQDEALVSRVPGNDVGRYVFSVDVRANATARRPAAPFSGFGVGPTPLDAIDEARRELARRSRRRSVRMKADRSGWHVRPVRIDGEPQMSSGSLESESPLEGAQLFYGRRSPRLVEHGRAHRVVRRLAGVYSRLVDVECEACEPKFAPNELAARCSGPALAYLRETAHLRKEKVRCRAAEMQAHTSGSPRTISTRSRATMSKQPAADDGQRDFFIIISCVRRLKEEPQVREASLGHSSVSAYFIHLVHKD